ncbi:GNAT family protein [Prauserella cavernicola]|uniref:GNAT family N-acetyltransferase n=1 Tax=Prauserella cavernicola TaxID=2800127 RepID=A0A934QXC2_9PSEU|nr:GNAT family protein [Prauserella cavernicola]MBK1787877.1 GNAT family N-acetyltransferase [Prauserella cavernicola]
MLFPHVESKRVLLRPASKQDGRTAYDILFRIGRTPLPVVDSYMDGFLQGAAAQLLLQNKDSGDIVGFTEVSEPSDAGHAQVSVHIDRAQSEEIAIDAAALTVNFAFAMWRIRKVYFHTHEESLADLGFVGDYAELVTHEAVLADHMYFQGRHWDMHIHSISRNRWDEHGTELVKGIV